MARPDCPTPLQSLLSTLLLLALSLVALPFTLSIVLPTYIWNRLWGNLASQRPSGGATLYGARRNEWIEAEKASLDDLEEPVPVPKSRVSVLVNGGRTAKSLALCRALARAGCRVALVEEEGWGDFCAAQFSSAVSSFHLVPPTTTPESRQAYVSALVRIALEEQVDLFIPCSGPGSTAEDARAAEIVSAGRYGRFRGIIQSEALINELQDKNGFIALARSLGLKAPESHLVTSVPQALSIIRSASKPLILKATATLGEQGRADLTTYPLKGDSSPDLARTRARLEKLDMPITEETPYVLQEVVENGSRWCTHATVVEGNIKAFVCCPSNDMLMTYVDATRTSIGLKAFTWTSAFLTRLSSHPLVRDQPCGLTGHFSFSFIYSPSSNALYALACHPWVHTSVVLLASNPAFALALLGTAHAPAPGADLHAEDSTIRPVADSPPRSWVGHELAARWWPRFLPDWVRRKLHPLWRDTGEERGSWPWCDPTFTVDDPLPFAALYHLQWPVLLVRQILRGRAWSRINVSTARIFEC